MRNFLRKNYAIISIIGPHAGETEEEVLLRKREETEKTGKSFWLYKSYEAKPNDVQNFCEKALLKGDNPICIFIKPSSINGAQSTKRDEIAKEFSIDKSRWNKIQKGILVTGFLKNSFAMIFDKLDIIKDKYYLNLWDYSLFPLSGKAVKTRRGASTVCCVRESSQNDPTKMVSNIRRVVAVGELVKPFSVWLR